MKNLIICILDHTNQVCILIYVLIITEILKYFFYLGINCNIEYTKSDGSYTCGFFLKGPMSWVQANEECENHGATLPIIKSDPDNQKILSVKV